MMPKPGNQAMRSLLAKRPTMGNVVDRCALLRLARTVAGPPKGAALCDRAEDSQIDDLALELRQVDAASGYLARAFTRTAWSPGLRDFMPLPVRQTAARMVGATVPHRARQSLRPWLRRADDRPLTVRTLSPSPAVCPHPKGSRR
jgi:hypothetical protein